LKERRNCDGHSQYLFKPSQTPHQFQYSSPEQPSTTYLAKTERDSNGDEEHEQKPTADRFPVHSECVRARQSLIDFFPSQPYHTAVNLGRYRSPGDKIPFLVSTVEMNYEIAVMAVITENGAPLSPSSPSASWLFSLYKILG